MPGRGGFRQGAGRRAVWQDPETQTIRVPVAIKDQLLDIGKGLDQGQEFYDGQTCSELQRVVQDWESKCQQNNLPEWQLVHQLLGEIQEVLSRRPVRARRCRRTRHGHSSVSYESEHALD